MSNRQFGRVQRNGEPKGSTELVAEEEAILLKFSTGGTDRRSRFSIVIFDEDFPELFSAMMQANRQRAIKAVFDEMDRQLTDCRLRDLIQLEDRDSEEDLLDLDLPIDT